MSLVSTTKYTTICGDLVSQHGVTTSLWGDTSSRTGKTAMGNLKNEAEHFRVMSERLEQQHSNLQNKRFEIAGRIIISSAVCADRYFLTNTHREATEHALVAQTLRVQLFTGQMGSLESRTNAVPISLRYVSRLLPRGLLASQLVPPPGGLY